MPLKTWSLHKLCFVWSWPLDLQLLSATYADVSCVALCNSSTPWCVCLAYHQHSLLSYRLMLPRLIGVWTTSWGCIVHAALSHRPVPSGEWGWISLTGDWLNLSQHCLVWWRECTTQHHDGTTMLWHVSNAWLEGVQSLHAYSPQQVWITIVCLQRRWWPA